MKKRNGIILATMLVTTGIAAAQPPGNDPPAGSQPPPPNPPTDGTQIGSDADNPPPGSGDAPGGEPTPVGPDGIPSVDPYATPSNTPPPRKKIPRPMIDMPEVLGTPTGWLLPAAVLYSRTSLDTGGGVTSDTRVGLGDVAEFGIATTDAVRERLDDADTTVERIQPYVTASFRVGIGENRTFIGQPGVTVGFRKSFERNHDNYKTRIAELTVVASKHLFNKKMAVHLGAAMWDASVFGLLEDGAEEKREFTFHDRDIKDQMRAFGGLQFQPLPRSQILVDLGWSPEFCYRCASDADRIRLRPTLSWGVRYQVANFMMLESGVRVPDIADLNLLDAQIFGQVTFTSWALRRAVDSLK
ncbi:MAG: hypothetical protein SFX73_24825 [Kofleriaceae bacterium]|nr:hypothetical protein [Kofleriaceae bacterium]